MLSLDRVGAEALEDWKRLVDLGDHVGVSGEVQITSRRGELSVLADEWPMTAKALRPLPVAHKPMCEEARVRQRYVDLIVRPQAREMVRTRAAVVRSLRDSLHGRDYLEVETPMLQLLHGGAAARPFVTHSNALDTDLYLRIAPELFFKRGVVGGIERVFEINRNFRNEGIDSSHSPEFAMLEAYQAYADYDDMAELTRQSGAGGRGCAHRLARGPSADGTEFDLGGEWRRVDALRCALRGAGRGGHGRTRNATRPPGGARREARCRRSTRSGARASWPRSCSRRSSCRAWSAPTFVRDYPEETTPLTRAHRETPGLTEKWDLYVRGFELGTAYSEAGRPGGAAGTLVGAVAARRRRAIRGDAAGRGLPARHGVRNAADGGMGMGIDRF